MKTSVNKRATGSARKGARRTARPASATTTIRHIGDEWAKHWNVGDLDKVVAAYAPDAVYLPPHHEAVHGRDPIRRYLEIPLDRGVRDLSFEVTYIKQSGNVAWDVGTYRMSLPQNDGTMKEDRGKYDAVIVGYLRGRGMRAKLGIGAILVAVYDAKTDSLPTIAKIGSGLTEQGWIQLRESLDLIKLPRKAARVQSRIAADVWTEPRYVVTVLADQVTRSPVHTCGLDREGYSLALHFPRMVGGIS